MLSALKPVFKTETDDSSYKCANGTILTTRCLQSACPKRGVATLAACQQLCTQNGNCVGLVYNRQRECHLKRGNLGFKGQIWQKKYLIEGTLARSLVASVSCKVISNKSRNATRQKLLQTIKQQARSSRFKFRVSKRGSSKEPRLRVGIFGGSNSIDNAESYTRLLQGHFISPSSVKVFNRAIGATGTLLPSFCLTTMLPPVDVVVIESAANDAITWPETVSTFMPPNHPQLHPVAAMERVLRHLPRTTHPIVFAVCGDGMSENRHLMLSCESLHANVAARYNASFISLRAAAAYPVRELIDHAHGGGIHMTQRGHVEAARLVAQAIKTLSRKERFLPPAAYMDPAWENIDEPWRCRVCTPLNMCLNLRPTHTPTGFAVREREALAFLGWRKFGWEADASPSAHISFAVEGHVLLAFACADSSLSPSMPAGVAVLSVADKYTTIVRRLHLNWTQPAAHMCVAEVATRLPPGSILTVETGTTGAVKIYGIFEQDDRYKYRMAAFEA